MRALRYRYLSPEVGIERGRGEPQEIDHYTFVSTLFTREAMAVCGFPNRDFYYYGEDADYALRLAEHGFKSYVVPRCVVEHAGGGFGAPVLLPVSANWRYYYMYRNQLALVRSCGARLGPIKRLACRARIMMGLGKRLLIEIPPRQLRRLPPGLARCRRRADRAHGQTGRTRHDWLKFSRPQLIQLPPSTL